MNSSTRESLLQRALSSMASEQFVQASQLARQVVKVDSGDLRAVLTVASAEVQAGNLLEARTWFDKALRLDPNNVQALSGLSTIFRSQGALNEASQVAAQLIRTHPKVADGYLCFGQAAMAAGDVERALTFFAQSIALQPDSSVLHLNMGIALVRAGKKSDAIRAFEHADQLSPEDPRAGLNLAGLLYSLRQFGAAERVLRRLLRMHPKLESAHVLLAKVLLASDKSGEAQSSMESALKALPGSLEIVELLGLRYHELGRFEDADRLFRSAVQTGAQKGSLYWGLVQGKRVGKEDSGLIGELETALASDDLSSSDAKYLHYALGKSLDDLGLHERALDQYHAANRFAAQEASRITPFVKQRYDLVFDSTIKVFTEEFIRVNTRHGNASTKPIFVLGMMRSGTTLIEQILSSHPDVTGGGEIEYMLDEAHRAIDQAKLQVIPEIAKQVSSEYLAILEALSPVSAHVTDKMPQNFLLVGLIHLLFPNAKIVHSVRNIVDTCLSIYMTPYRKSPDYAHVPADLVYFAKQYLRLMDHWRSVLPPGVMVDVSYEELVANPEPITRSLISFCDLDWDDRCLAPENNTRVVQTSSMWQARQPIYSGSVARWKRYEPWLGEFAALLEA